MADENIFPISIIENKFVFEGNSFVKKGEVFMSVDQSECYEFELLEILSSGSMGE